MWKFFGGSPGSGMLIRPTCRCMATGGMSRPRFNRGISGARAMAILWGQWRSSGVTGRWPMEKKRAVWVLLGNAEVAYGSLLIRVEEDASRNRTRGANGRRFERLWPYDPLRKNVFKGGPVGWADHGDNCGVPRLLGSQRLINLLKASL